MDDEKKKPEITKKSPQCVSMACEMKTCIVSHRIVRTKAFCAKIVFFFHFCFTHFKCRKSNAKRNTVKEFELDTDIGRIVFFVFLVFTTFLPKIDHTAYASIFANLFTLCCLIGEHVKWHYLFNWCRTTTKSAFISLFIRTLSVHRALSQACHLLAQNK